MKANPVSEKLAAIFCRRFAHSTLSPRREILDDEPTRISRGEILSRCHVARAVDDVSAVRRQPVASLRGIDVEDRVHDGRDRDAPRCRRG